MEIYDFVDPESVKVKVVNCKLKVPVFILTEIYIINSITSSEKWSNLGQIKRKIQTFFEVK